MRGAPKSFMILFLKLSLFFLLNSNLVFNVVDFKGLN